MILEEVVQLSKAMSDIHRVEIVTLIQREEQVCVCEICDTLQLSQPLVSRHLKQLKSAGVLTSRKEGKWVLYEIIKEPSTLLKTYLSVLKEKEGMIAPLVACTIR
jgi:ArsR family transcriptional regulator